MSLPPPPQPASPHEARKVVACEASLPAATPCRLAEALRLLWPERFPTVTSAKRAVRRREVLVDGRLVAEIAAELSGGELVQCVHRLGAVELRPAPGAAGARGAAAAATTGPAWLPSAPPGGPWRLGVAFEDCHLACVVKPPGIPTDSPPRSSRAAGSDAGSDAGDDAGSAAGSEAGAAQLPSVYRLLAAQLAPSGAPGALRRPRHVHRLDLPTGGLLLVAKTRDAQHALSAAFEQRRVCKRYRALVWGRLEGRGLVRYDLSGRKCETEYAAVRHTAVDPTLAAPAAAAAAAAPGTGAAAAGGGTAAAGAAALWVTTVDLWPHTGRKHQLRRHMALLGHPLVGESRYSMGYAALRLASGQAMAADDHVRLADGGADEQPGLPPGAAGSGAGAQQQRVQGEQEDAAAAPAHDAALAEAVADVSAALRPPLCLWAVELRLESHPATGQPLRFEIPEPPAYAELRARLSGSGALEQAL